MVQHHNKKLVFGLGLLAVAVFCLLVCPTVTAGAVVTELYSDNIQENGDIGDIVSTLRVLPHDDCVTVQLGTSKIVKKSYRYKKAEDLTFEEWIHYFL